MRRVKADALCIGMQYGDPMRMLHSARMPHCVTLQHEQRAQRTRSGYTQMRVRTASWCDARAHMRTCADRLGSAQPDARAFQNLCSATTVTGKQ